MFKCIGSCWLERYRIGVDVRFVFNVRCYILHVYIYILLFLLYYTLLFHLPFLSLSSLTPLLSSDLLIYLPYSHSSFPLFPYSSTIILYVSVLRYPYLCSVGREGDDILTPHVLSEWMVEVCRFYMYGVCVIQDMMFDLVNGIGDLRIGWF